MGEVKRLGLRSGDDKRRVADVLRVWADRVERGEVSAVVFGALHGDDEMASVLVENFVIARKSSVHMLGLAHTVALLVGREVAQAMVEEPTTD